MVRVGVVGVGNMGLHHARVLSELPGAMLAGVCDADPARLEMVATRFRTHAFTEAADLYAVADAVVVAVPTELHARVGMEALQAGCHVLMEKPLAHCLVSARELCAAAERSRRQLMVGYVERFNPALVRLKEQLDGEELLSLTFTRVGPQPPRTGHTGVIHDLAIHDLDLMLHLAGREVVQTAALAAGHERQDTATLSFLLKDGILAHLLVNWLTPFKLREVQVATPQRLYRCDLMRQQLTAFGRMPASAGYSVTEIPVPVGEPLRAELSAFVSAVAEGRPVPVPHTEGLCSLALAEQCAVIAREAAASLAGKHGGPPLPPAMSD